MPVYQVTVKNGKTINGQRLEPGMSVQVVTNSFSNPVCDYDGKKKIADAFMRIYGIDMYEFNALSTAWLDSVKVG